MIDNEWISGLGINFPLQAYYKTIKAGLKVLFGVEGLEMYPYPEWSQNVYETFKELTDEIPEMKLVFQDLDLTQNKVTEGLDALR